MEISTEERLVRVKLINDQINKNGRQYNLKQLQQMEFMKFMLLNSQYGIRPRGGYGGHLCSFIDVDYYTPNGRMKILSSLIENNRINFDKLYNSYLYRDRYSGLYKIFEIDLREFIYFLGDYSHLKYHINFRKLREGVPSDFKYRASYNRSRRSKLV